MVRVYAVWPTLEAPVIAFNPGWVAAARWVTRTLRARLGKTGPIDAATWQALRARGLLLGAPSPIPIAAVEQTLGRVLAHPRPVFFSSNASANKVMIFFFEGRSASPSAVVKGMAQADRGSWLRAETDLLDSLHQLLADFDVVRSALPPPPLYAGNFEGEYLVIEAPDPAAGATGRATRHAAIEWLLGFHQATTSEWEEWGAEHERRELDALAATWGRLRPDQLPRLAADVGVLLADLKGRALPRCAVHGDFWSGNIACRDRGLRVYDWEWGSLDGDPLLDLWTYELAELREQAVPGTPPPTEELSKRHRRVGSSLRSIGIDPAFALACLPSKLAFLVGRVHDATGRAGGWEDARPLMAAVEQLVAASGGDRVVATQYPARGERGPTR